MTCGLTLTDEGGSISARTADGLELFRYVHDDTDAPAESPRPYLHPVRTLAGDVVTIYRPVDHLWHRGFSTALPNVGPDNFWGGPTYLREQGYVQLPNNGATVHERFARAPGPVEDAGVEPAAGFDEELSWITQDGRRIVTEDRALRARVLDPSTWTFSWAARWASVADAPIVFGSPTTQGRPVAGYGGFFWRGPREFVLGSVLAPDDMAEPVDLVAARTELEVAGSWPDVPAAMGRTGGWLGFVGRHDGTGRDSTVLIVDDPDNPNGPAPWFVRATPYACISPSPFYFAEAELGPEQSWSWRYDVVVHSGAMDPTAAASAVAAARGAR